MYPTQTVNTRVSHLLVAPGAWTYPRVCLCDATSGMLQPGPTQSANCGRRQQLSEANKTWPFETFYTFDLTRSMTTKGGGPTNRSIITPLSEQLLGTQPPPEQPSPTYNSNPTTADEDGLPQFWSRLWPLLHRSCPTGPWITSSGQEVPSSGFSDCLCSHPLNCLPHGTHTNLHQPVIVSHCTRTAIHISTVRWGFRR